MKKLITITSIICFALIAQFAVASYFTYDRGILVFGDAKIGDGGSTNYTEIKDDGEINLHGTARVQNKLWLNSAGLKAPGAKPASHILHGIDGAWEFSNEIEANQETVSGSMRVPNRLDITVAPKILIGWSADGISPGDCKWQLSYLWTSPGEDTTGAAQEVLTIVSTASATANGLVLAEFTGVDAPSATDACLHFEIKRLSGDAQDTIADTVELLGVCQSFTTNKLGTAL